MKLTVQQIIDVTLVVSQIIREQRPMPQRGKFRLARMHMKLLPEFNTINGQRDAMITAYGVHQTKSTTDPETGAVVTEETPEWIVPPEHMDEFTAAWSKISSEEIDIDLQPLVLADIDNGDANGSIETSELITLGELIAE